ncbi:MAG: LysR substrate-binding domain-containing protein [Acidobacteriota bacterium]|nr:LysR substrate-binding domain-containing protein [Acidobacteriota bacterium]
MELRHFRYFIAVAEELNLSRAAERLGTSQPSLGQQMRDLEGEVGVSLFERSKGKMELTLAGQFLLRQARLLLSSLESDLQAVRAIGRGESGSIVIGSSPSSDVKVLPKLLPAVRTEFPDLEFVLCSRSRRDELLAALLCREVDIAFLRAPLEHPELATTFILREKFMVVLPASDPRARQESVALKDLRDLPFLSNPPSRLCPDVEKALAAEGIDPIAHHLNWDTRNIMVDLNVIGSGMGFTLVPDYVTQIAPPTVAVRPLAPYAPTIDLAVAYRKDNHAPALGFVLSILRQIFHD